MKNNAAILSRRRTPAPPPIAVDYYVSATGTGIGTYADPMSFADAQTAIGTMTAGEVMAFKGGDEFYGNLSISNVDGTALNPITFTSYGTGKAVIKGSESIAGWTHQGGNIWTASTGTDVAYQVFKNNVPITQARTPAIQSKTARKNNYHTVTSGSGTTFVCSALAGVFADDALNGATIHILDYDYVIEKRTITDFVGATGQITISSNTSAGVSVGKLFIINGHSNLLTVQDYWNYNANVLSIYSTTEPTGITITTIDDNAIYAPNSDYLVFDNLIIRDFNKAGINSTASAKFDVTNCEFKYNYEYGIFTESTANAASLINVSNSSFTGGDTGILCWSNNSNISNNTFTDIGLAEYMTTKKYDRCSGYYDYSGTTSILSKNTLTNIGYTGLSFYGPDSFIEKNYVKDYCLTKHDGGGIYTYTAAPANAGAENSIVEKNTVVTSPNVGGWGVVGIYMDDHTHDVIVRDNNVTGGIYNFYLHNNKRTTLTQNNAYLAEVSPIHISEDVSQGSAIDNIVTYNKTFSTNSGALRNGMYVSVYSTMLNMADFDYNIYYSTYGAQCLTTVWNNWANTVHRSLADWQTFSGQDLNSASNTKAWTTDLSFFAYNETDAVKVVSLPNAEAWETLDGIEHTGSITLQPYTSEILVQLVITPYGPELVVNGDFASSTGWTAHYGTISGGVYAASTGYGNWATLLERVCYVEASKTYKVELDVSNMTAGAVFKIRFGFGATLSQNITTNGHYNFEMTTPASIDNFIYLLEYGGSPVSPITIDNLSVKEKY